MTPDEFVDALRKSCRDGAVDDCIALFEKPPGRRPPAQLVRLSLWFNTLSQTDREFVVAAMREAADASLFGVLCVIDGVRVIEPEGEKSEFTLTASKRSVVSQLSPSDTYLHDIYRSEP